MPRGRPLSIRWWLGGLVAAVALPLLVLLTWTFVAQVHRQERDARDTSLRIAKATAARLSALHRDSIDLLGKMAARPAIRDFDGRTCDSLFAIVDFFPQFVDVFLFDRAGRLECAASPQGSDRVIADAARLWIESELRAGHVQPRAPLIRDVAGRLVSIIAVPVTGSDGTSRGSLVLLALPDLGAEALPPGGVVTILDRNGTVLARTDAHRTFSGRNVSNLRIVRAALREQEGRTEGVGVDGVARQYGFTQVPETGWIIYAGLPTATVMQPVRLTFERGLAAGALIIAALIVLASLLGRMIKRPIDAVARAAQRAGGGAFGTVEEVERPREIAELSRAFNDMVESRSRAEQSLKALSDRLLVIQEQERTRIAREIHDDLGQSLTALKMDVVGLLGKLESRHDVAAMRDRIVRTLDATVGAVQRISSELRPSALDDLGLAAALESEAQLFEERTGIECELSLPKESWTIDPLYATAIYRTVQEALTNVARHSNASRVELRLRRRRDELLLEIRDDGRGVTPEQVNDPSSLGLIGIRERVQIIGGSVKFEGVDGRGTIVSVRIPMLQWRRPEA